MKPEIIAKICVDIGMTLALLLLMPYELVGQAAHEWLGIGIFILFIVHHILNGKWSRNILLGLCVYVPPSWFPLEHDDGNGRKISENPVPHPHMDIAYLGIGDCGLWHICFCKTGYWKLYAAENPVCIL